MKCRARTYTPFIPLRSFKYPGARSLRVARTSQNKVQMARGQRRLVATKLAERYMATPMGNKGAGFKIFSPRIYGPSRMPAAFAERHAESMPARVANRRR